MRHFTSLTIFLAILSRGGALNIVLTNDDGWAVAQIRSEYDALRAAGHTVIISAPAINKSGTGSSSTTPTELTQPCEFNTCPIGSPAEGFNVSDPFLNYVNAFPVDSARYGIQTLAPKLFGSGPDLVISGSNVGNNLGPVIKGAGTIGAAAEGALEGIPSIAFSGATAAQISYTTLDTDPTSKFSLAAHTYNTLTLRFLAAFLDNPGSILPPGVVVNVNYPGTENCPTAADISFVFTRIAADSDAVDVETCGTNHLPDELATVRAGCFASVSVFNATTIADVGPSTQGFVLNKLGAILTCLPA